MRAHDVHQLWLETTRISRVRQTSVHCATILLAGIVRDYGVLYARNTDGYAGVLGNYAHKIILADGRYWVFPHHTTTGGYGSSPAVYGYGSSYCCCSGYWEVTGYGDDLCKICPK